MALAAGVRAGVVQAVVQVGVAVVPVPDARGRAVVALAPAGEAQVLGPAVQERVAVVRGPRQVAGPQGPHRPPGRRPPATSRRWPAEPHMPSACPAVRCEGRVGAHDVHIRAPHTWSACPAVQCEGRVGAHAVHIRAPHTWSACPAVQCRHSGEGRNPSCRGPRDGCGWRVGPAAGGLAATRRGSARADRSRCLLSERSGLAPARADGGRLPLRLSVQPGPLPPGGGTSQPSPGGAGVRSRRGGPAHRVRLRSFPAAPGRVPCSRPLWSPRV